MAIQTELELIQRLRELGPFRSNREALQACCSVLRALGELLDRAEREAVAAALPAAVAKSLREAPVAAQLPSSAVLERIAARLGIQTARAIERTEVVLSALGELLTPTARARLVHALPELAPLLSPRELGAELVPEDGAGDRIEPAP